MAILRLEKMDAAVDAVFLKGPLFHAAKNRWPGDGAQLMYTFSGGNVASHTEDGSAQAKVYLPCESETIFADQNIGPNELFRIRYRKTAAKTGFFEVKKLGDAAKENQPPPASFEHLATEINATPMERKLTTSINNARQEKAQQAASLKESPAAPATAKSAIDSPPQQSNGSAPAPAKIPDAGQTSLSQLLAGCMVAAIDAAVVARDYAHSKGLTLSLSEESVQDLTSTLMIHLQKMAELECRYQQQGLAAMARVQQNGGHQSWARQ